MGAMILLSLASMLGCGLAAVRTAMKIPRTEDMHSNPVALGVAGGGTAGLLTLAVALLASRPDGDMLTVLAVLLPLVGSLGLGVCAWQFLTWRNQTIVMLDEERFLYTNWLGKKREYRFSELLDVRRSLDDVVLSFADGKVRFDATAEVSKRLELRLIKAVQNKKEGDPA